MAEEIKSNISMFLKLNKHKALTGFLNVSHSAVSMWKIRGYAPILRCKKIASHPCCQFTALELAEDILNNATNQK